MTACFTNIVTAGHCNDNDDNGGGGGGGGGNKDNGGNSNGWLNNGFLLSRATVSPLVEGSWQQYLGGITEVTPVKSALHAVGEPIYIQIFNGGVTTDI